MGKRNFNLHWGNMITGDASPNYYALDPEWECPFDCLCFMITVKDLNIKDPQRYKRLLTHLIDHTGYEEQVFIHHGDKVRKILREKWEILREERRKLREQGIISEGLIRIPFPIVPLDLNP